MPDTQIWLLQLLCPARHCLCATPYEPAEYTQDAIEATLRAMMQGRGMNPWCGICGSRDITAEHAPTPFTDWEAALVAMRAEEAKQLATRALLGGRY
jgi:hypothetical protein